MKRVRFYQTAYCDNCRRPFKASRKDARWCSPVCRQAGRRAGQSKSRKSVTDVTLKQLDLMCERYGF